MKTPSDDFLEEPITLNDKVYLIVTGTHPNGSGYACSALHKSGTDPLDEVLTVVTTSLGKGVRQVLHNHCKSMLVSIVRKEVEL